MDDLLGKRLHIPDRKYGVGVLVGRSGVIYDLSPVWRNASG